VNLNVSISAPDIPRNIREPCGTDGDGDESSFPSGKSVGFVASMPLPHSTRCIRACGDGDKTHVLVGEVSGIVAGTFRTGRPVYQRPSQLTTTGVWSIRRASRWTRRDCQGSSARPV